jgi:hypothetical protein
MHLYPSEPIKCFIVNLDPRESGIFLRCFQKCLILDFTSYGHILFKTLLLRYGIHFSNPCAAAYFEYVVRRSMVCLRALRNTQQLQRKARIVMHRAT